MVINKKRQTLLRYHPKHDHIQKKKKKRFGTHMHTPQHEQCLPDIMRMYTTCHGLNKRQT